METLTKTLLSRSPLTNKTYTIPQHPDDRAGIDAFLSQHPGKKIVVVQGLGFVGSVMCLVLANALTEEYAVIGIDVFPVLSSDPKVEQFYKQAREKKNLYASFDPYAYSKADVIVIDINLDVKKQPAEKDDAQEYDVDLNSFSKALETIGSQCRHDVLILVETTVPPGTCEKIVKPIIEQSLTRRGLPVDELKIGHSYERVMPGPGYIDSIQNFYRVFAGVDEKSTEATEKYCLHG